VFSLFYRCIRERLGNLARVVTQFSTTITATRHNGRFFHADEQTQNIGILLSNRLGEEMYSTVAPMMGLPLAHQVQRLKAKERSLYTYMPGIYEWPFQIASEMCLPFHNSMDGTRIMRMIELYEDTYLIGKSFPADIHLFPKPEKLPTLKSREQQNYILSVRTKGNYAAEAYSLDLVDTTGTVPDLMPEATTGVTASHLYAIILEVESKAAINNVSLICTDSALN